MASQPWKKQLMQCFDAQRHLLHVAFVGLALMTKSVSAETPDVISVSLSPSVTISATVEGRGRTVVMLPSWARGAADFADMRARLASREVRVVTPEPRGIGASRGPLDSWNMAAQADDIAAVIRATNDGPVVLLGHAYGNRVARAVASRHPELVCDLILVAAGGKIQPPVDILRAISDGADPSVPLTERRRAIARAHFAPGHDAAPWLDGWYPAVGRAQQSSVIEDAAQLWWNAGTVPILLIQPRQDAAAPAANAELLKRENPNRVDLVYLENAGHAAFPEQPENLEHLISERIKQGGCNRTKRYQ